MPIIEADAMVITPEGPRPLHLLSGKHVVLALVGGVLRFTESNIVAPPAQKDRCTFRVMTTGGDLAVGGATHFPSVSGLVTASQLWESRRTDEIGRMAGEWPKIERLSISQAEKIQSIVSGWKAHAVIEEICRASNISSNGNAVLRVSFPGPGALKFLQKNQFDITNVETGPTGWCWIRRRAGAKIQTTNVTDSRELCEVLEALWLLDEESRCMLMELSAARFLTAATLPSLGLRIEFDYKPLYAPHEVTLVLKREAEPFAKIRSIQTETQLPSMLWVNLAKPGAYLYVNGVFCAD